MCTRVCKCACVHRVRLCPCTQVCSPACVRVHVCTPQASMAACVFLCLYECVHSFHVTLSAVCDSVCQWEGPTCTVLCRHRRQYSPPPLHLPLWCRPRRGIGCEGVASGDSQQWHSHWMAGRGPPWPHPVLAHGKEGMWAFSDRH